jgi:pilus assembly protein Flp/PilA
MAPSSGALIDRRRAMKKVVSTVNQFARDEEGAALIEYTVLIGLMLVGVVATVTAVGTWVSGRWTALNTAL